MNTVLTCLDHSIYTQSVLDHAIWAATRVGGGMELLHTLDRHPEHAAVIARVLAIPLKRFQKQTVTYLTRAEATALIVSIWVISVLE